MSLLELRPLRSAGLRLVTVAASTCVVAAALATPATAGPAADGAQSRQIPASHVLHARLLGSNEVPRSDPASGDPNGTGRVRVTLRPGARMVCARARWHHIGTPVAAHIHHGRSGVSGDVVVDLTGSVTPAANCVSARRGLIRRILDHPRRFYFNIHTARFSNGAIRGQLHQ